MSIRDIINVWMRGNQPSLFWHDPAIEGAELRRFMLISSDIRNAINGPWETIHEAKRFSQLRGTLDAFVEGRIISVATNPYDKAKSAFIARVDSVGTDIWDIRSIDPKPGIRVLGCFAETDLFVCLVWAYRADLDGPGGKLWEAFIQRAAHAWQRFFLGLKPHSGSQISDYISDRFFVV